MIHFDRKVSEACPSGYLLDKLLADELADPGAVRGHLSRCAPCARRVADLERHRARFQRRHRLAGKAARRPSVRLRVIDGGDAAQTTSARPRRRAAWAVAGSAVAAAALVFLVIAGRSGQGAPELATLAEQRASTRVKGGPIRIDLFVDHDGQTRPGGPGEIVHPGDVLSFASTSPEGGFLAILSRDGAGAGSVYVADGGRAIAIEPGSAARLPQAVKLDGVLGPETLFIVACDHPVAVEPLRGMLAAEAALAAPPGCRVDTIQIEKRAR
jgi:hypothetical protein